MDENIFYGTRSGRYKLGRRGGKGNRICEEVLENNSKEPLCKYNNDKGRNIGVLFEYGLKAKPLHGFGIYGMRTMVTDKLFTKKTQAGN
jgi:hypothetical protein